MMNALDETAEVPAVPAAPDVSLDATRVLQTVRPYVQEQAGTRAAENRERGAGPTFALSPMAARVERRTATVPPCPTGCREIGRHVHTPGGYVVSIIGDDPITESIEDLFGERS